MGEKQSSLKFSKACVSLSTWILMYQLFWPRIFLGKMCFENFLKSDKFVMGGELELMGIPGLLKGSNE